MRGDSDECHKVNTTTQLSTGTLGITTQKNIKNSKYSSLNILSDHEK